VAELDVLVHQERLKIRLQFMYQYLYKV
jgi:hypothetical protein